MMGYILSAILVMALVTYLPRVLPLTLFTGKLASPFWQSFLAYVPYAVLGAMTFPGIFYATESLPSALLGTLTAVIAAYSKQSLLTVALCAVAAAAIGNLLF